MALRRGAERDDRHDGSLDLSRAVVDEITWYMREHKVSRADVAQSMGVSPGRVSQILSGDENLTLRTLAGVVSALGARVELTLRPLDEPEEFLDEFA
jgi:transcriptional regulator with XRE-family HTH domain